MRRVINVVIVLSVLMFSSGAAGFDLESRIVEHTLGNGMKFLLMERHTAPTCVAVICFDVGAVNEPFGATGLVHIFEHMAFKGTRKIGTRNYAAEKKIMAEIDVLGKQLASERGKGREKDAGLVSELREKMRKLQEEQAKYIVKNEFDHIFASNGAVGLNAMTGQDSTTFFIALPSNRLELWMLMEAERMRKPVLREFYQEIDVITEERRLSIETYPLGKLYEQFYAAAFTASPYGTPIIGWMSDIQTVTREKAKRFFEDYYTPSNAVGAIIGDIDIEKTKTLLDRYFGPLPAKKAPPLPPVFEPPQRGEKRIVVEWDAEPFLLIGFHKPSAPHDDDYTFDIIGHVLTEGRTSRLYKRLVLEDQTAVSVNSYNGMPGQKLPDNLFVLSISPRHPHTVEEVEATVWEELERLKREPLGEGDLQKTVNAFEADFIRSLRTNYMMAITLTYFETAIGDWRYTQTQVEKLRSIKKENVMAVAGKYLKRSNSTVAFIKTVREETD